MNDGPAGEGPFFRRSVDVLLVVSIEFCMVFWSTDYLITEIRMRPSVAAVLAGLFLAGMAAGRAAGGQAAGRLVRPRPVFLASLALTGLGFVLFWSTRVPALAAAGLIVTGLGVALLYPLSLARALAAEHERRDRASARAALASGLAIGIAPFALAALSADVGLRPAFLIVPLLVAGAFANALVPSRRRAPATSP
jgi:MFS family permease